MWLGGLQANPQTGPFPPPIVYSCSHCNSTDMFLAYKDGMLVKVLEDHEDVEGLDQVGELLCTECNKWFPNPTLGEGAHRKLTGELVTVTGLKGKGTIKVIATGITMPFHYDSYEEEVVELLRNTDAETVANLKEFCSHHDHILGLRAKETDNPNTWLYRINTRKLWRKL